MNSITIRKGITIDEPENVERAIYNLCGVRVSIELIKKFVLLEKNTIFYLDRKMKSSTEPGKDRDYLWIDTGFRDPSGKAVFICLHNSYNGYVGHYTGTIKELAGRVRSFNEKNKRDIDGNYSRFLNKYKKQSEERDHVWISDPMQYAVLSSNDRISEDDTAFAKALKGIEGLEEVLISDPEEAPKEEPVEESIQEEFSETQEEITVGLLCEQMEKMQNYINELLILVENNEKKSEEEIRALKEKNEEYKSALANIRTFMEAEEDREEEDTGTGIGHDLLGRNEKILVLGNTDIRITEMRAIARDYFGFEKADFEFITDYAKIKNAGGRIHGSNRFAAVIFGNCPHKVASIGGYSSIIEEFKNRDNCPISVDARTEAGGLKITKQSFKNALYRVCMELKDQNIA